MPDLIVGARGHGHQRDDPSGRAATLRRGEQPVALNFASAKNPGGGFLSGARAQEESIARSSALFACIEGRDMYRFHRERRDAMYTNYAIYSPAVPVFRDDHGELLETPYPLAIITAPAPNTGAVLNKDGSRKDEIDRAFRERIERVLRIAAAHGHETIILGAWGCGAFRGDPKTVSVAFFEVLSKPIANVFRRIVFAVFDPGKKQLNLGAFRDVFAGRTTPT